MKKAYVCNDCGFVYSEEDVWKSINEETGKLEPCCIDNCQGFNLELVEVKDNNNS